MDDFKWNNHCYLVSILQKILICTKTSTTTKTDLRIVHYTKMGYQQPSMSNQILLHGIDVLVRIKTTSPLHSQHNPQFGTLKSLVNQVTLKYYIHFYKPQMVCRLKFVNTKSNSEVQLGFNIENNRLSAVTNTTTQITSPTTSIRCLYLT